MPERNPILITGAAGEIGAVSRTMIDTSNYYPYRDGAIAEVEGGKPESIWVCKTQVRARGMESAQETILASALCTISPRIISCA